MYFKLISFNGIAPILEPRLLKNEIGVTAQNVNLERGNLNALYTNGNYATLNGDDITSYYQYKFGGTTYNLEFADDVNVQPGPIADDAFDRLYWTGQTFPRMASSTQLTSGGSGAYPRSSFRLGIETPPNLGVATPTGPDDGTQIKYSTSYVYTFVSAFGEEGPPSAPSSVVTKVDGQSIALSNLSFVNSKSDVNYGGTKVTGVTVTTASGSNNITITTPSAHGFSAADRIGLDGFSDTGGFTAARINHAYSIVSTPSSTTFTVSLSGAAATSTATSSAANLFHTFIGTKRIYRSNTGSNTTDFQFVAEVAMDVTTYTDSTNNDALGEIIPSTFWIAPPDDDSSLYPNGQMKGLTAIGNGIFAGFSGKRLCFSEPFLPHAWPVAFRITLEDEIVGISMAGNVLFIGTKGTNYIAAGTDPQAMTIQKLEAAEPLLYKRSLVDMGGYCIYSGPDGLIAVENGQVTNLTQSLISPDQWKGTYVVQSAGMHEGKYVGQNSSAAQTPQAIIFDIRGDLNSLTTVASLVNTDDNTRLYNKGFYTDPDNNQLYVLKGGTGGSPPTVKVESFDDSATDTKRTFVFKSKEFVLPRPASMNFVKVEADSYTGTGVTVKVFGDGTEIFDATITASGSVFSATGSAPTSFSATQIQEPILRLPTGVHKVYQVEVTSANPIHEICIGESIDELRSI